MKGKTEDKYKTIRVPRVDWLEEALRDIGFRIGEKSNGKIVLTALKELWESHERPRLPPRPCTPLQGSQPTPSPSPSPVHAGLAEASASSPLGGALDSAPPLASVVHPVGKTLPGQESPLVAFVPPPRQAPLSSQPPEPPHPQEERSPSSQGGAYAQQEEPASERDQAAASASKPKAMRFKGYLARWMAGLFPDQEEEDLPASALPTPASPPRERSLTGELPPLPGEPKQRP